MKKICLSVLGIYLSFLHGFAQFHPVQKSEYELRPLKVEEVHFVSSYYGQNGDHSAIMGGKGTEQGYDLANGLEVKWVGYNLQGDKTTLDASVGIDYHSFASQAYVSQTGASKAYGTRFYPQLTWTKESQITGKRLELGVYYSGEYDYHSFGLNTGYGWKTHKGGDMELKLVGYFDRVKLIYPSELIPNTGGVTTITSASGGGGGTITIPSNPRTTLTASYVYSQVINERLQGSVLVDGVFQTGELGLPFHRVYFKDGTDAVESLPSTRFKLPVGLRMNYYLGDVFILRGFYRFYIDSWGIQSHTLSLEVPVKLNAFFSFSPFYRFYTQTQAQYFAPYGQHVQGESYYSSNYALSAFDSHSLGLGFHSVFLKGIAGIGVTGLDLRYSHYLQTTGLVANSVALDLRF